VVITDADIREAIMPSINAVVESIKEVLESTPPEVVSDIIHEGIVIVGGGAPMAGLVDLFKKELKLPIHMAPEPGTAVVRGAGIILENLEQYKDLLIDNEDELPPR
jgi:rod shape-determining protein MreB